jgi:hypothetical protein
LGGQFGRADAGVLLERNLSNIHQPNASECFPGGEVYQLEGGLWGRCGLSILFFFGRSKGSLRPCSKILGTSGNPIKENSGMQGPELWKYGHLGQGAGSNFALNNPNDEDVIFGSSCLKKKGLEREVNYRKPFEPLP